MNDRQGDDEMSNDDGATQPIDFSIRPGPAGGLTISLAPGGAEPDMMLEVHMDERAFHIVRYFVKARFDGPFDPYGIARIPAGAWLGALEGLSAFGLALEAAAAAEEVDWFGLDHRDLNDAFQALFAENRRGILDFLQRFRRLILDWTARYPSIHFFGV